jgi:hypothetical protein
MRFAIKIAAALLVLAPIGPAVYAQPWQEGFEGPQPSWRDDGGDASYRIVRQQRTQSDAHSGACCEVVELETANGAHLSLSLNVGEPAVIKESSASIWVKSDHAGIQLALCVVLPRAINPQTRRPLVAILKGENYTEIGRWQQLHIQNVAQQLLQQVHALRRQWGPQLDAAEATIDAVLLNVYAGPGSANV